MAVSLAAVFATSLLVENGTPQNEYQTDVANYRRDHDRAKVVFEKKVGDHGAYKETLVRELVVPFGNGAVAADQLCIAQSYKLEGDVTSFDKASPLASEYAGSLNADERRDVELQFSRAVQSGQATKEGRQWQANLECGEHLEQDFAAEIEKAVALRNLSNGIKPVKMNLKD